MEHDLKPDAEITRAKGRSNGLLAYLAVVLTLILALLAYQTFAAWQRSTVHKQKVIAAQGIIDSQQKLILDLVDSYHKDAYEDAGVDRIAEQQLIATEYTLTALQVLGIQNTQIIELLSDLP